MDSKLPTTNRLDERRNEWLQRASVEVQHNPAIVNSRDFIRLQRNIYNEILKDFNYKDLNRDEKISYRLMRAQARSMNKALYPNRVVRASRGTLVAGYRLSGQVLRGVGKVLNSMLGAATSTNGVMMPKIPVAPQKPAALKTITDPPAQKNAVKNGRRGPEVVQQKRRSNPKEVQIKGRTSSQHL